MLAGYCTGSGTSFTVRLDGMVEPSCWRVMVQVSRRAGVEGVGGSALRPIPTNRTVLPSGISVAWMGDTHQPSLVRNTVELVQPSATDPRPLAVAGGVAPTNRTAMVASTTRTRRSRTPGAPTRDEPLSWFNGAHGRSLRWCEAVRRRS